MPSGPVIAVVQILSGLVNCGNEVQALGLSTGNFFAEESPKIAWSADILRGLQFGVRGLGCSVQGVGCRVWGVGCRVLGAGCGV